MKITPFYLFLILLIILVVSAIFGKNNLLFKESFVSFQERSEVGDQLIIPTYSSTNKLHKLYDNLYFDSKNGNIIEIDSPNYDSKNLDSDGNSIISTIITKRQDNNNSIKYLGNSSHSRNVPESYITTIANTYTSYSYHTLSENTNQYCIIYIPKLIINIILVYTIVYI